MSLNYNYCCANLCEHHDGKSIQVACCRSKRVCNLFCTLYLNFGGKLFCQNLSINSCKPIRIHCHLNKNNYFKRWLLSHWNANLHTFKRLKMEGNSFIKFSSCHDVKRIIASNGNFWQSAFEIPMQTDGWTIEDNIVT